MDGIQVVFLFIKIFFFYLVGPQLIFFFMVLNVIYI